MPVMPVRARAWPPLGGKIGMTDQSPPAGASETRVATQSPAQVRQMQALLRAPVPKIHANGIGMGANATDVTILLFDAEQLAGTLILPYSVAKSLANSLNEAIKNFEEKTGDKVRELDYLVQKMTASEETK
ncbi:MAG: hypothetical protein ABSA68_02615 [Xanthobacteraceae bacterium]|jgi:hypothetical protein